MSAKMMIVVRHDLKMRKGKIAAQAGHACVEVTLLALAREGRLGDVRAVRGSYGEDAGGLCGDFVTLKPRRPATPLTEWFAEGTAKVCVYVSSLEELLAVNERAHAAGLLTALIEDAGHTEFHGRPTFTCLAIEPAAPETVDPITGNLPLY